MSVSARQRVGVVVGGVAAAAILAYAVVSESGGDDDAAAAAVPTGTVSTQPSRTVDVVALSTPAQAAIAVSNRLFTSSDLAVLSGRKAADRKLAVATATRLKVPVLLDDPAAPAELTRLRAKQVLTFGTTVDVVGAVPASTSPSELAAQVDELLAGEVVGAASGPTLPDPDPVDAAVLMKSATTFDVAAATARIAGATVVQTSQGDPRRDAATAAALRKDPEATVIALGAPFTDALAYSVAAVRAEATQIGGGYLATEDRVFVGLHGRIGDPRSGMLGQQDTAGSIDIIEDAAGRFAANDSDTVVPMFEVVATAASARPGADKDHSDEASVADLEPVLDAAEKAGVYVLLDLQPGSASFLEQARRYEDLLERKNVGLTLEPRYHVAPGKDPLQTRGSATAAEVDETVAWLADVTAEAALPQKLLVVRETRTGRIDDRADIDTSRPEVAVVLQSDVAGDPTLKLSDYAASRSGAPAGAAFGWMQYKTRDDPLFTVNETYRQLSPYPSVVTYQ